MKERRFATIEEIAENRRARQNTSNLCICQKKTKYAIHFSGGLGVDGKTILEWTLKR